MASVTTTYAKENIDKLWEMSKDGPVVVNSNGVPVAVVLSPKQFEELTNRSLLGHRRNLAALSEKTGEFDSDAYLSTDLSEVFSEYMPR